MVDLCKIFSDLQENTMRMYAGEFDVQETKVGELPAVRLRKSCLNGGGPTVLGSSPTCLEEPCER